jgi:hypothetical protein
MRAFYGCPLAPDQHDVNERHFVFGYGSLVAEHARGHIALLRGWRRTWGVAMDNTRDLPGYKSYRLLADGSRPPVFVAFIDISEDPACELTGVCVPVEPAQLHALDGRERNYDRIDVTDAVDGAPPGHVWAYHGSEAGRGRLREGLAAERAVVSREYLESVLAGVAAIAPHELEVIERSPGDAGLTVLDLERVEIAGGVSF